jgi:hypothetical protein
MIGGDILLRVTTAGELPWGDRTLEASSVVARVARGGAPAWHVPYSGTAEFFAAAADTEIAAIAFYVTNSASIHGLTFRHSVSTGADGMMALVALDSSTGGLTWTAASSTSDTTQARALALGERGVYVLAQFGGMGGLGAATPTFGSGDFFLARFARADGALSWARVLGSEGIDYPRDMSCDAAGRCRISFDFDGSPTYFGEEYVAENYYDSAVLSVEVE